MTLNHVHSKTIRISLDRGGEVENHEKWGSLPEQGLAGETRRGPGKEMDRWRKKVQWYGGGSLGTAASRRGLAAWRDGGGGGNDDILMVGARSGDVGTAACVQFDLAIRQAI